MADFADIVMEGVTLTMLRNLAESSETINPISRLMRSCTSGLCHVGGSILATFRDKALDHLTTTPTKLVVVGAAAVGATMLVRSEPVRSVAASVKGRYRKLRVWLGAEPAVVVGSMPYSTKQTTLESVRSGSVENRMPSPKFQAMIGEMKDGEFHVVGNAVRMRDWLVMPAHVYAAVEKPFAKGLQSHLDISQYDYEDLDTDLIALKMSNKDLSVIGVRDAGLCYDIPRIGMYVSVIGSAGLGTTGILKLDAGIFGRVTYNGTTVSGYSGAAYMSGSQLVGIHTNGGAVNGGYAAGYVKTLLQVIDKTRDESSEDWLANAYANEEDIMIDPKWSSLDEIRIQVGGRFAIVSKDSMRKAFGNNWMNELQQGRYVKAGRGGRASAYAMSYGDLESGEVKASSSGGSTLLEQSPELENLGEKRIMDELRKLSKRSRRRVLDSLGYKTRIDTPVKPLVAMETKK